MFKDIRVPDFVLDEAKSMACVHCGLCLGACPTYLETGNENDSPRGRIYLMRAMQSGRLSLNDSAVRHIDLCLGCRACETACPSGVPYGELLETTRDHIEHRHHRSLFQRFLRRVAIERVFPFPARMKLALLPARGIKKLHLDSLTPKFIRDSLALIPDDVAGASLPEISKTHQQESKGRVGFISGCVMSVLFGKTNEASVQLLNQSGYDVVAPSRQACCGALYAHSGKLECARDCARRNIAEFEKYDLDTIIINAAGCGSTLKEYGHLLKDDPAWKNRAERFSASAKDLSEFLFENSSFHIPSPLNSYLSTKRVTYHDACHLAHPQGITRQPRELVRAVAGANYVELPEAEVCCGSAGSYNLTEPEMAERLQQRKIRNILETGAEIVVTTNPGCILQIAAGLKKTGEKTIKVIHLADYLIAHLQSSETR